MKNGFKMAFSGLAKSRKSRWPLAALLCAGIAVPGTAQAATFTVSKLADTNDGACNADCSLREAIIAANNSGGTNIIDFASTVTGNLDLAAALPDLGSNITLQGPGSSSLTVRRSVAAGTAPFRLFTVINGVTVTISGLTLTNGFVDGAAFGGAISNDGTLTLTSCHIGGNSARASGNVAAGNKGNDAQGGAIFNSNFLNMIDCLVNANIARGADSLTNGQGGVALGGAIFNDGGDMNIGRCTFSNNSAVGGDGVAGGVAQGGAIRGDGNITLTDCILSDNSATGGSKGDAQGGALYCSATTSISRCTFENNTASGNSGGVGQGGAIRNSGSLSLNIGTLTANTASGGASTALGGSGGGGGLYNSGTATSTASVLNNNSATGGNSGNGTGGVGLGGGIYNSNAATLTLNTITLSTNSTSGGSSSSGAAGASLGGGLFMQSGGTGGSVTVIGSTVTSNKAADGSGILVSGGSATLNTTLVAGNTGTASNPNPPSPDVRGALAAASQYNLIGNGNGMTGLTNGTGGNQIGTSAAPIDAKLGPLQDNGGPTPTHGLLPGSPALDKGKSFNQNADQRGQARPYDDPAIPNASGGDGTDIGAFEAQLIQLSVSDPVAALEGSAAAPGKATFNITLTAPSNQSVKINYLTANGTTNGAAAGSDYVAKSGQLTFAPGETVKRVTINFIGDSIAEQAEPFFLDLHTPVNATIADSRGVAYIRNDDGPGITIDNAKTVDEGNSGTTAQTFTVRLSAASTNTVTVNWATANGTAGPADYTTATGTLTFAPGQTSKIIVVLVKGDTVVEPTETYRVNLSTPTFAVLADSQGIGYIRNDDTATGALFEDDGPSE